MFFYICSNNFLHKIKLFSITLIILTFFSCTPDPCGDLYVRKINPYTDEGIKTYIKSGDGNRDTDLVYTEDVVIIQMANYQVFNSKNGLDHGKWIFYYQNGNIETIGNFNEGKELQVGILL